MNNLHLVYERCLFTDFTSDSDNFHISRNCDNFIYVSNHHKIFLFKFINYSIELIHTRIIEGLESVDSIICIEKLSHFIIIFTKNGLVITCNDFINDNFILKSQLGSTCSNIAFKNDLSIFAAVIDETSVFLMDSSLSSNEPIAVIDLNSIPQSEINKNVGWGKKQTQFRGQGKKFKENEQIEKNDENISVFDDKEVKIQWRNDGKFIAVSFFDSKENKRRISVWNDEGIFESVVKEHDGVLCPVLSWIPNGYWISSVIKTEKCYQAIHFERNGLKRCGFSLDFVSIEDEIIDIEWNSTSNILAIFTNGNRGSRIQLYTMMNFYWYFKFEFSLLEGIIKFSFFNDRNIVCLNKGSFWIAEFMFEIDSSIHDEMCSNTVIDGKYLYFTPYGFVNIPPPLCLCSAQIKVTPSSIAVSQNISNSVKVFLFNTIKDNVEVVDFEYKLKGATEPKSCRGYQVEKYELIFDNPEKEKLSAVRLRNTKFMNNQTIIAFGYNSIIDSDIIFKISFEGSLFKVKTFTLGHIILCSNVKDQLIYQSINRSSYIFNINEMQSLLNNIEIPFSHQIEALPDSNRLLSISLDNELYINSTKFLDFCNQIYVTERFSFIIFKSSKLLCLKNEELAQNEILSINFKNIDEREIEKGSLILGVIDCQSQLVLQAPRGNIEIIYPRLLVINNFKIKIEIMKFKECLLMLRRHRIDLNLFIDHDPQLILNNMNNIICDVDDPNLLIQILNEIKPEDSSISKYKNFYSLNRSTQWNCEKISKFCECLRNECLNIDKDKYKLVVVLSYLKQDQNGIELALKFIKNITYSDDNDKENSLKFLNYYIEPDLLYKKALETHDLELSLMAAQLTSKDPKEYISYLEKLEMLDEDYRNFTIENDLKNFKKAFICLTKCQGRDEECIEYAKIHNLHSYALGNIEESSPLRKLIGINYAEKLGKTDFKQSATIYFQFHQYDEAFDKFCQAGSLEEAIICLHMGRVDNTRRESSLRILIDQLIQVGDYVGAGRISEEYFDIDEAIELLIKGHLWIQSFTLISKKTKTKFHESNQFKEFKNKIVKRSDYFLNHLENQSQKISLLKDRILKARTEKYNNKFSYAGDVSDSVSQVSSISDHSFSNRSIGSSYRKKNKKPNTSKYFRNKPGSPYEDFACTLELATEFNSLKQSDWEIKNIIKILIMFNESQLAYNLMKKQNAFKKLAKNVFKDVWKSNIHLGPFSECSDYSNFYDENVSIEDLPIIRVPDYDFTEINFDIFKQ